MDDIVIKNRSHPKKELIKTCLSLKGIWNYILSIKLKVTCVVFIYSIIYFISLMVFGKYCNVFLVQSMSCLYLYIKDFYSSTKSVDTSQQKHGYKKKKMSCGRTHTLQTHNRHFSSLFIND